MHQTLLGASVHISTPLVAQAQQLTNVHVSSLQLFLGFPISRLALQAHGVGTSLFVSASQLHSIPLSTTAEAPQLDHT